MTRTPLRIPLGGGGTDLPAYYSRYGGYLVSAAINKYVYITLNPRFEDSFRVSYSRTEIADSIDDIQHPIVREALRLVGIDRGLEIVSIADIPANTGLGSSSSFAVGLLNALHTFKREHVSPHQLAEEAYQIEVEILGEPIGKQDQYLGAFGGITALEIERDGSVRVSPVRVHDHTVQDMEGNLLLFYTGI
ncbi:MAG: sugar kinase, partial [Chloroflexi bacterium]|nr:sugar kinase [Chloroflexota bacterium]